MVTKNTRNMEKLKIKPDNFNEKCVEINLNIERSKNVFEGSIDYEYLEKTVLYGYMIMFGNVFSLAPLLVLVTLLFTLRTSSRSMLWYYRRPIAYKGQTIGIWLHICRFLNAAGIINLSIIKLTNKFFLSIIQIINLKAFTLPCFQTGHMPILLTIQTPSDTFTLVIFYFE